MINLEKNEDFHSIKKIIYCEICDKNSFKYKCPKCSKKTCSLICVKEHKKKFDCSGFREKFSLSSNINEFGDKELYEDIKFLNEGISASNKSSKFLYKLLDDDESRDKEKRNKYKRKILKKIRNINLYCSPMIMTRFSENQTFVNFKDKTVYWSIKFNFFANDGKRYSHLFKETFDDSQYSLMDLINYLFTHKHELELSLLMLLNNYSIEDFQNFQILYRINLKEMDKNLMKGKLVKLNKLHYEDCNKQLTLKELLEGKDIYDFPEFNVMIK